MPIVETGRDDVDVVTPPITTPRRWTWFVDVNGRPKLKDDTGTITDFTGSTIYSDPGVPSGALGKVNDLYINETTRDFYIKTGASTWTGQGRISGSTIYTGSGAPAGGTGLQGDLYVRSNGDYYIKDSDTVWGSVEGSLQGPQGIQGNPGVVTTVNTAAPLTGGGSAATLNLGIGLDGTTVENNAGVLRVKPGVFDAAGLAAAAQAASQPLDADLTAIAALAGQTAFGRDFLTVVDQAGARTKTGAQTQDADLDAIAALTTTAYGRGQLTYADAAAATAALNAATTGLKGLMSIADKIKADGEYKDIVADFGADSTGAVDCTAIIQTAVNSFATGGRLYFPQGSYKVDLSVASTITISKSVIIIGAGRNISNIICTHATKTLFTFATGSQGAGFEQIRISGATAGTRTAGHMVDMAAIPNVYMQQCDILFCWGGVHSGGALQFVDDMNIREVSQNAASGQAILVDGAGDRYIRRLTTDSGASIATAAGVRINECSSCVITDSNIIHAGTCIALTPNAGGGHQVASVWVMQSFLDTSHYGFSAVPATNSDSINRVRLIGCWMGTMTTGGALLGNASINVANSNSISFIGCEIYQCPVGIDSLGVAEWDVRSSRIAGSVTAGIRVAQGAQAGVQNFTISDNFIGNGAGFGQNLVGITIGAGTYGRYQILDNRGLETNGISPVGQPGLIDLGTVGPTGQKNVSNNMGALVAGSLMALNNAAAAVINSRGVVTVGTAETFMIGFRIPANSVSVGQVFRMNIVGQHSALGALTSRIRAGSACTIAGTTQIHSLAFAAATTTLQWTKVEAYFVITALGPTGTVTGIQFGQHGAATNVGPANAVAEVLGNVPTTADWFIAWTAAESAGTFTIREAVLEAL